MTDDNTHLGVSKKEKRRYSFGRGRKDKSDDKEKKEKKEKKSKSKDSGKRRTSGGPLSFTSSGETKVASENAAEAKQPRHGYTRSKSAHMQKRLDHPSAASMSRTNSTASNAAGDLAMPTIPIVDISDVTSTETKSPVAAKRENSLTATTASTASVASTNSVAEENEEVEKSGGTAEKSDECSSGRDTQIPEEKSEEQPKPEVYDFASMSDAAMAELLKKLQEEVSELEDSNSRLREDLQREESLLDFLKKDDKEKTEVAKAVKSKELKIDVASMIRSTHPPLMDKASITHRERVVLEILTTEQTYVTNLTILIKAYLEPLSAWAESDPSTKALSSEIGDIFFNLPGIYSLNQGLLTALEERIATWDDNTTIGDIFSVVPKWHGPYSGFGAHYQRGLNFLKKLCESSPPFNAMFNKIDDQVTQVVKMGFSFFFVNPVQRPPRYSMLIRDLLSHTQPEHPDFTKLQGVAVHIEAMSAKVNEKIKETESVVSLTDILARGGGFDRLKFEPPETLEPFIPPDTEADLAGVIRKRRVKNRVWVKTTEILNIYSLDEMKRHNHTKKRELMLFNDIVVGCQFVGKKNNCNEYYLPCSTLWVKTQISEEVQKKIDMVEFKNYLVLEGPESSWLVGFKLSGEVDAWLKSLHSAIIFNGPKTDPNFLSSGERIGEYNFKEKGTSYDGTWLNRLPHKYGVLKTASGMVFDGLWHSEFRTGFGTVTDTTTGQSFKAGWKLLPDWTIEVQDELWANDQKLTEDDWKLVMTGAEQVPRGKDEVLIEQGKKNSKLIRCKSGSLRIEKEDNRGVALRILQAGAIVGDTAVIQEIGSATAYVVTNEDCELEEISVHLLMKIFRNNPGLCFRFYHYMAMKLAENLRSVNKEKSKQQRTEEKSASENKVGDLPKDMKHSNREGKKERRLKPSPSESLASGALVEKWGLPAEETLLQTVDVIVKDRIKKVGNLYIFQKHVVFEYSVFGVSKEVISLEKVKAIKGDDKKGTVKIDGRVFHITNAKEFPVVLDLLFALWEDAKRQTTESKGNTSTKRNVFITLEQADKELILKGAEELKFKEGEDVVVRNSVSIQSIYQIVSGKCNIVVENDEGSEIVVATLGEESFFGELSFLEDGEDTRTSASVRAACEDVTVLKIDGWYLNCLFIVDPHVAGKFYSFLCSILAVRLNDRENQRKG